MWGAKWDPWGFSGAAHGDGALVPAGKISFGGNLAARVGPEFSDRKLSKTLILFNMPTY